MTSKTHIFHRKALLIAPVLLVALSGCVTSDPTPDPTVIPTGSTTTETTAAACTPESATITWSEALEGEPVVSNITASTIGADGTETVTSNPRTLEPVFTGTDQALGETWEEALLRDVRRTGQVPEEFGATVTDNKPMSATITTERTEGTLLFVVTRSVLALPFTVDCGDGESFSGTLSATDNFETANTLYDCGYEPAEPTAAYFDAITYCPAG